jgi:hypothetical protein
MLFKLISETIMTPPAAQVEVVPSIDDLRRIRNRGGASSCEITICHICDGFPEGFSYPCLAMHGPKQSDFHLN